MTRAESTGKSLVSPSASNSTATTARIKPISRVMMLMPVLPSALAMRPEAMNTAQVTAPTTTP